MIWHYNCPECGRPVEIDWDWLKEEILCPGCSTQHYPPTPSEDHFAYVGTDRWPKEMETAVVALRGMTCAAPGCFQTYSTLVFRRLPETGGRTSVDNLIPLCAPHTRDKGARAYDEWAEELKAGSPARAAAEAPGLERLPSWPAGAPPRAVTHTQMIVSSAMVNPGPGGGVVFRAPFLRVALCRLVFEYDWRLKAGAAAKVILVAWPHDQPLDPVSATRPGFVGLMQENSHSSAADAAGSSRLELGLPTTSYGRWGAAVVVSGGEGLTLGEYLLVGTD
ncbi:HNH endonuclease [candidate division WOR-3 bacterium]|nr:HNH endonuclease [candidate division WOR-3 bacterium]